MYKEKKTADRKRLPKAILCVSLSVVVALLIVGFAVQRNIAVKSMVVEGTITEIFRNGSGRIHYIYVEQAKSIIDEQEYIGGDICGIPLKENTMYFSENGVIMLPSGADTYLRPGQKIRATVSRDVFYDDMEDLEGNSISTERFVECYKLAFL